MVNNVEKTIEVALFKSLSIIRDLNPDITIGQAMCLLGVAYTPGITQRELCELIGTSDGYISRSLAVLSDIGGRYGAAGLDLIKMEVDPKDRRMRRLYLTRKGERFLEAVTQPLVSKKGK